MPALPDRSGRALPDTADVVVIGGGYAGITAAAELARRGVAVTLLEAETLGWGASTRNGGIVHPGYKWGPRQLVRRYGETTGGGAVRRHAGGVRDGQAAHRRRVDRLRLPRESATSSSPTPRRMSATSSSCARAWPVAAWHRRSCRARSCTTRSARTSTTRAWSSRVAVSSIPADCSRVSRHAADRAGADLHEGRPGALRSTAGGRSVHGRDRAWRDPGARRVHRHERLHRRRGARRSGAGSSRSAATSSPPNRCPTISSPSSRRAAARSSTRRTSCTTGTSRPTSGWSSAAGRACSRRASTGPRGSCTTGWSASIRSSPGDGSTTPGAATSASRSTGCRTSGGRPTASRTRSAVAGRGSR